VLPRWFGVLPALGVREAYLFWAVPGEQDVVDRLDRLATDAKQWSAQLEAVGIRSELSIKRGVPGPWLTALAGIYKVDLIVLGPPTQPGSTAETLSYLVDNAKRPILVLPPGQPVLDRNIFARALIDMPVSIEISKQIKELATHMDEWRELDVSSFTPARAARAAARSATEMDATIIVLTHNARDIATPLAQFGGLPLLIVPEPRPSGRRPPSYLR
jgi:hypothetical protein